MGIDAGFRRRRSHSRRSLPMVVGLPFVALAVSAGCWSAAPAGGASPTATVVAVAPWADSAGSAIAPPPAARPDGTPPAPCPRIRVHLSPADHRIRSSRRPTDEVLIMQIPVHDLLLGMREALAIWLVLVTSVVAGIGAFAYAQAPPRRA